MFLNFQLLSLVGSLLSVMASMLLPCICYLKIFGTARCSMAEVALIVMITVLGSLVAASGGGWWIGVWCGTSRKDIHIFLSSVK